MKNFPNRLLPVLTPVDAAIALGIQDDEEMMEKVATWIQIQTGELTDLEAGSLGIPQELLEKLEHLLNPPACSACPYHSIVNKKYYCGMRTCYQRKTQAWEREKLRAASKNLGIPIYDRETDGAEFRVLEDHYYGESEHHKLFTKRSADLRLALAVDIDRKKDQRGYTGVPQGSVVMLVGKTLKALLETGQKERAAKRSKEQAAALLARLLEEKREALDWEMAAHVKVLFDGINLAALEFFWDTPGRYGSQWEVNRHTLPASRKPAKDASEAEQADFLRRVYAMNMVRKIGGHYRKTLAEYATDASEKIKSWGVKLPKSIAKLAAQMDEEIKAATEDESEE